MFIQCVKALIVISIAVICFEAFMQIPVAIDLKGPLAKLLGPAELGALVATFNSHLASVASAVTENGVDISKVQKIQQLYN